MFTISPDRRIRMFLLPKMEEGASAIESESMTSLAVASDGRHVLVTVSNETRPEVPALASQCVLLKF